MKPWRGWTLVDMRGVLVVDSFKEPFIWARKKDAEDCREAGLRVVRCTVTVDKTKHASRNN